MSDGDKAIKPERGDESRPSLESFRQAWIDSRLHPESEIATFFGELPADLRLSDARGIAQHAVRIGKLTRYQAQAILTGKTKALVLDSYVILDKLGQGGMGQVFRAKHLKMGRVVALKVLPSSAMRTPEAVKRFHKEIQAAAKLSHPNIVTAYDAGEANRIHFLVMEYVDGKDLRAVLRERGVIPVATAIDYILQAARGIDAAHRQGIVHRDIKPENLLLDGNGIVKVLDMGLARVAEVLGDEGANEASLTRAGQVMGTPDYMAPEQGLDTKRAEERSDIYSLGCTLHTLLIGRPPFRGETLVEKILAHRDRPIPSLTQQRSDVPESLDRLYQSMIAKRVEDRPASMTSVVQSLEAILRSGMASDTVAPTIALMNPPEPAETATLAVQPTVFAQLPSFAVQAEDRVQTLVKLRTKPKSRLAWVISGVVAALAIIAAIITPILLRASTGIVALTVDRPGAKLTVQDSSGEVLIKSQTLEGERRLELPAQPLKITIELEGFETYQAPIEPMAGAEQTLAVRLKPLEPEKPVVVEGSVKLVSEVPGFAVQIVDATEATTELHSYQTSSDPEVVSLPPGRYRILAAKDGYDPYEASITILSNREIRHELAVRETPTATEIASNPTPPDSSNPMTQPPAPLPPAPMPMPENSMPMPEPPAWAGWPDDQPPAAIAPFDAREARRLQQVWAEHLGFGKGRDNFVLTNSIGMIFVLIPPGEYMMGATPDEIQAIKESYRGFEDLAAFIDTYGPQRKVIISRPFFLAVQEVTKKQVTEVLTGYLVTGNSDAPVFADGITAIDFCIELAKKEGLPPNYNRAGLGVVSFDEPSYRLPTEAEWEFAARAGTTTRFWFGDDYQRLPSIEVVKGSQLNHDSPSVLGPERANPFGLVDLFGNTREFTFSTFVLDFFAGENKEPWVDPNRILQGDFCLKGGDFRELPERSHVTMRISARIDQGGTFGMRIALDVEAAKKLLEKARPRR